MTIDPVSTLGRGVAVGLVLATAALILQVLAIPLASAFRERWETIQELEENLIRYAARAGSIGELQRQRDELTSRQVGQIGLFGDSNAALAGATLQGVVRRTFEGNGGALRSLQALPVRTEGTLQRVAVRIDGTLPSGKLLDLLYAAEAAVPYMFFENLELRVPDSLTAERTGHAQISLRAEIAAYRQAGVP